MTLQLTDSLFKLRVFDCFKQNFPQKNKNKKKY